MRFHKFQYFEIILEIKYYLLDCFNCNTQNLFKKMSFKKDIYLPDT